MVALISASIIIHRDMVYMGRRAPLAIFILWRCCKNIDYSLIALYVCMCAIVCLLAHTDYTKERNHQASQTLYLVEIAVVTTSERALRRRDDVQSSRGFVGVETY